MRDSNLRRGGEASIISIMMVMLITVILASAVYYWGSSMVGGSQRGVEAPMNVNVQRLSEDLAIETVEFGGEGIKLHVRNTGSTPSTVDAIYVNDERYAITPQTIKPGEKAVLTLSIGWERNKTYRFALATSLGNLYETYVKAPLSWLEGWSYRKKHEILGSTVGSLSNYQVKIVVHYGSGTDSGENVYVDGKSQPDFDDVRFTGPDGETVLNCWLEAKKDGDYAIFWVKIPSIPAHPEKTTIYIYYGNASALSISNGPATFIFFDDFDKWEGWVSDPPGNGVGSVDQYIYGGDPVLRKKDNCDPSGGYKPLGASLSSYRLLVKERRDMEGSDCKMNRYGIEDDGGNGYGITRRAYTASTGDFGFERRDSGSGHDAQYTTLSQPYQHWYITELTKYGSTLTATLYDEGGNLIGSKSGTDSTHSGPFTNVVIRGGRPYYVAWIAVASYVYPEPSHGDWGPEETP